MPIDPLAALNAMIRAEAARIKPAGPPTPDETPTPPHDQEHRPGRPHPAEHPDR
ncbi:hypothetical protein N4G70_14515 [Streptomyces sp. ASQP_92]|uniref:hypothetical protein n=1 Tax=Streptomyces sp. ASQP_92 TaxID=2979116 RepID=UPI0021BF5129|nr:hypothetical protein [Streptomyces sp. ASQP_92]MCT9090074.1 hypothetical protein [Streptomyces sp. ASQP_92]